jgi:GMP synthase (glutamine-hydrolysing)
LHLNAIHSNGRTVLVVQHVAFETLGTIEPALRGQGLTPRYLRVHEGDDIPSECGNACGLVVMGGPMGVYERDRLPHLTQEMRLIEAMLAAGRPVLGVCLGSQLLAAVLGARVYPARQKEIGWHRVRLSESARRDPLWASAPAEFQAFHWHGDVFDLPNECESLASSDLTACQAFRSGALAYGILFHPEVTESILEGMVNGFADELVRVGGSPEQIRRGMKEHLPQLSCIAGGVFDGWAGLAAASASIAGDVRRGQQGGDDGL